MLVVSLLSFGMIDSAVTKDKGLVNTVVIDFEKERELELLKIEEERIRIEKYHQEELENFFTDPEPSEKPSVQKKKARPPKTGKIFLGQEDIRHFEAYKKFLKEEQGITDIRHKRI